MRFQDTVEGWIEQVKLVKSNPYLQSFVRSISKEEIKIVEVRKLGGSEIQSVSMCHPDVLSCVEQYGGKQVFGWILNPWQVADTTEFDGVFNAIFHSCWLTPEGELVTITPQTTKFQMFLPDVSRKFDFSKLQSYNNRTIYLDQYKVPKHCEKPIRNVSYFSAGGFVSRDRNFERYQIPTSLSEVRSAVPASMRRSRNGISCWTAEGIKWAHLKFAI